MEPFCLQRQIEPCFGDDLRYCHEFKKWIVWDGRRWAVDATDQARRRAKLAMLEFLKQAVEAKDREAEKFAKQSLDYRRISSMLSVAECEIPIVVSALDSHPFLWAIRAR